MYLFFDTETTGLISRESLNSNNYLEYPYVIEIAWMFCNENGDIIENATYIIKNNYKINDFIRELTGITQEDLINSPYSLEDVIPNFLSLLDKSYYLIAHNISYDIQVLKANLFNKDLELYKKFLSGLNNVKSFCTMKETTNILKLPKKRGGYKHPKLVELFAWLFKSIPEQKHRALEDVKLLKSCFFKLKKDGLINV